MAYRDRALVIDSLGNNWNGTSAPAAGTSCITSVSPAATERIQLGMLGWSIRNTSAAAYTATLSVRDSSTGGTVLASWDIVVAATTGTLFDTWAVNIKGLKGKPLQVDFGTPATSVTQKVSIAGWKDSLSDG